MFKFTLLVTTPRPHRALPVVVVVAAARVHGVPHPARRQPVQRRGQRGDLDRDKQNTKSILITVVCCVSVTSHEPRGPSTSTWCTMSWRRVVALKYWPPITMSTLSQLQEQCEAWHGHGTPASPGTGDQPDQGQEGGPELHAGPLSSHCTQIQHNTSAGHLHIVKATPVYDNDAIA